LIVPKAHPIHERQQAAYDELWRGRDVPVHSPDLIRHRYFEPQFREPILDIGAGDGVLARRHPNLHIISMDLSTAGLKKLPPGRSVGGAAEALPFKDGHFATLVLSEVLEHVADPIGTLSECRRVVAANGKLLLTVPAWPLSRAEHVYHRRRIRAAPTLENLRDWDPHHERRYDQDQLLAELQAARWKPLQVQPLFGDMTTFLMYFLEPRLGRWMRRPGLPVAHWAAPFETRFNKRGRFSEFAVVAQPATSA
jgi:SAM-dependent methyltransferase